MYTEVAAALRAADSPTRRSGRRADRPGSAFTSGQDLAEMGAIATGAARRGRGPGASSDSSTALTECSFPPPRRRVAGGPVGLGSTFSPMRPLFLVATDARLPAIAESRVSRRGRERLPLPGHDGLQQAARILLTSDCRSGGRIVSLGLALRVVRPREPSWRRGRGDWRRGSRTPPRRHPAITSLMRARAP